MLRQRLCLVTVVAACSLWSVMPAAAQIPTNASLKGAYNVRYLGVNIDFNNPADQALSFSGTFTFDGNGAYTVTGQGTLNDLTHTNQTLKFSTSGTYKVLPGGNFEIQNPFDPAKQAIIYGGLGTGLVVGSSTDTVFADLFVAIPVATSASAATLTGKYYIGSMEFQNGDFTLTRNTFFPATANGSGSFGDFAIKGTALNLGSAATSQTSPGVTYTMTANGTGTLNIPVPSGAPPTASQLLVGNKILYVSQDGNFFVAGGQSAYDMVFGVKALTGNTSTALSGLYFTAYLENLAEGGDGDGIYGSQGSANEVNSIGTEISHQRTNWEFYGSYDLTTNGAFTIDSSGTAAAPGFSQYAVGAGGNVVLGTGDGTNYQLNIYAKSPAITGTGVFLNPQGVVNAASNVPFTAQVAPGEVVSLYGSGMTSQTATTPGLPFPTSLGGAQVNVSWLDSSNKTVTAAAPIYYASPTLISAVVPYNVPTDGTLLNFQVVNGSTTSNTAIVYSGFTSPGIFTVPSGGLGNGAILHSDFSLVTPASPAKVGETVQIFLTGMGAVTGGVAAGAAAPSNPLSTTTETPDVFIDGVTAKVIFSGLAPTLGGLYQINATIPNGVTLGSTVTVGIQTGDADNFQATIPISK